MQAVATDAKLASVGMQCCRELVWHLRWHRTRFSREVRVHLGVPVRASAHVPVHCEGALKRGYAARKQRALLPSNTMTLLPAHSDKQSLRGMPTTRQLLSEQHRESRRSCLLPHSCLQRGSGCEHLPADASNMPINMAQTAHAGTLDPLQTQPLQQCTLNWHTARGACLAFVC